MEGIKNSVLSNSILFPLNSKTKKKQSSINLDYMNEIAKLQYDSSEDENSNNIYKTMHKNKLENIYNNIFDKIINLQTNIKEKKTWMNNDLVLEIFFYLGKLDNILENNENYDYISIIKKDLLNDNLNSALENLLFLKKI